METGATAGRDGGHIPSSCLPPSLAPCWWWFIRFACRILHLIFAVLIRFFFSRLLFYHHFGIPSISLLMTYDNSVGLVGWRVDGWAGLSVIATGREAWLGGGGWQEDRKGNGIPDWI